MSAAQRDERRNRLAPKVRQLLVTEIQGLESLYASTPKSSPDRPKLMRRLAEGYVELEAAAFRDKTENGMKADEAKRKGPGARTSSSAESDKANKILEAARAGRDQVLHGAQGSVPEVVPEHERQRSGEEHGLHGRGALLPRVRVRAGQQARRRAQGLPRADPELAAVEVHPQRVPRVRRALLQRRAG